MVEEREEGNQEKGQLRMLGFGICCFSELWLHVNATRPGDHRENKQRDKKNKKGKMVSLSPVKMGMETM